MGKQQIIELNGKRYDALTGTIVRSSVQPKSVSHSHKSIDGFTKSKTSTPRTVVSVPAHRVEKSNTLMRTAVKKPVNSKETIIPTTVSKDILKPHLNHAVTKTKITKAQQIPKSELIKRFSEVSGPLHLKHKPLSSHHSSNVVHAVSTAKATPDNIIEGGLANATSHEQQPMKKSKRHTTLARKLRLSPRTLSSVYLVLAVIIISGFFVYQNSPNLSMRLASAKAGVHGSLPNYKPAGFAISGGISYKPGQITVSYKSNSDDRNFRIIQNTSAWDSNSLLENYVAVNRQDYQTIQDGGKTVYLYDGSNATWVDGGIWYRVEGNSQLNSDQLLHLASSL